MYSIFAISIFSMFLCECWLMWWFFIMQVVNYKISTQLFVFMIAKLEKKVTRNQDKAQFIFVWKKNIHLIIQVRFTIKEFVFPKTLQKYVEQQGERDALLYKVTFNNDNIKHCKIYNINVHFSYNYITELTLYHHGNKFIVKINKQRHKQFSASWFTKKHNIYSRSYITS